MAEEAQPNNHPLPKWNGKVPATVKRASADQIWTLFTDFFNIHRWFSNLPSSYMGIHDSNGQPGCIRYCSGFTLPSTQLLTWSKERLNAVDHSEIVDCNIGFKSYASTVQNFPDDDDDQGCLIEWGFTVDPVEVLSDNY